MTNGTVTSVLPAGDVVYIGGLVHLRGPPNGHGVPLDAATGAPKGAFPSVNGDVYCVEPDGEGGWFIGGRFSRVGEEQRSSIAHIDSGGNVSAFDPGVSEGDYVNRFYFPATRSTSAVGSAPLGGSPGATSPP